LEKAFQHLRKLEEETRKAEAQRREQDRLEAAKRKEMQRITNVSCQTSFYCQKLAIVFLTVFLSVTWINTGTETRRTAETTNSGDQADARGA
jgi:hypothetical protein